MIEVNGMWCEIYDLQDCIEIIANEYNYNLAEKISDFIDEQVKDHEKETGELRSEILELKHRLSEYEG